jgi:hypothetical protein
VSLLNVKRHGINEVNTISLCRQPFRISSWAATDIGEHCGWRRNKAVEQQLGTGELKRAGAGAESVPLESSRVIGSNVCSIS